MISSFVNGSDGVDVEDTLTEWTNNTWDYMGDSFWQSQGETFDCDEVITKIVEGMSTSLDVATEMSRFSMDDSGMGM